MPAAPPAAVCEEKKGCTEAELPVTVHPHHLEVATHHGGCWLSAAPAVAGSCLHPQPVVPSAPRSSVREPEQVTGYCYSLQALRRAAEALHNLPTAANSARKALRTLTHGRAHGRAVHHQRAVNRAAECRRATVVDRDSEAGDKHRKKFPIGGAIVRSRPCSGRREALAMVGAPLPAREVPAATPCAAAEGNWFCLRP